MRTMARPKRQAAVRTKRAMGQVERRRLLQLAICIGLFFVVLLGRSFAPDGLSPVGERLLSAIQADIDFRQAFSALGRAVSGDGPVLDALGEALLQVFGEGGRTQAPPDRSGPAAQAALAALHVPAGQLLVRPGELAVVERTDEPQADAAPEPEPAPDPEPDPAPAPSVPPYSGPELPEGTTMDYVALDLPETVTPVMGVVTSGYGYRDHPVNGEYLFHAGADLAAEEGTPVLAFADGVVDFVGESSAYGLYVQLDHGNGVTSFYCHCSELYLPKGTQVAKGQVIAAVGETGNATGPHLHFELKRDGVQLNPIYYIETLEA